MSTMIEPLTLERNGMVFTGEPLTPEQIKDIEISDRQFAAGEWIDHDDFMKELDALYPDDES